VWTFFPLAAGFLLSVFVRPVFIDKYLFQSSLGIFLFAGGGFDFLARTSKRNARLVFAIGALIAIAAGAGLPQIYDAPKSTDWRGATAFILAHVNECGRVIVTNPYSFDRWPYYLGPGFDMRPSNLGYPSGTFWLAGVGHPNMSENQKAIGERMADLKWQGADALVYCVHH
jgi:hypothetical protein